MRLEPLISHTGILMTFYLSIILDLQNFFHWYIIQSWKLKRPPIQLRLFGKYMILKLKSSRLSYILVLIWPLSSNSRYKFKNDADEAVSVNRLLDQGYKKIRLIRSLKKFIFRYQDLVEIYSVSAEKIINDGFSYSENVSPTNLTKGKSKLINI
jgi:hypothetical protein